MTCSDSRPLLQIYLDNELSAVDARFVEEHLGACDACAGEVRAFRHIDAMLSDAVSHDPSASGPFGDCMRETYAAPSAFRRRWSNWGRAAVAASIVLGVVPFGMMLLHERASTVVLRAAVDEHMRAEMSGAGALTPGPELDALVARFAGASTPTAIAGMRLVGGHPCHVGDVNCAHLVYATPDGRVVSVYVSRDAGVAGAPASVTEVDGELVADGGGRSIVVGDVETRDAILRARDAYR